LKRPAHHRHDPQTITVLRKTPQFIWVKVKHGWVSCWHDTPPLAACGGLFRDFIGNYRGGFALKLGSVSVLHAELLAMIHAMKFAHRNSWHNLWIESDSTAALRTFSNGTVVPWDLRNRWSNCLHPGLHIAISQIYHKGNCSGLGLELAQSILCSTKGA
jgi:hypothetical protein